MGNTFREKIVEEGLEDKPQVVEDNKSKTTGQQPSASADVETDEALPRRKRHSKKKNKKGGGVMGKIFGGDILKHRWVTSQGKLVLLIVVYYLLIINNRYQVEQLSKQKIALEEEIKFLNEQDIKAKTTFQESIKISRIKQELDSTGIGIIAGAPYQIDVNEKEITNKK